MIWVVCILSTACLYVPLGILLFQEGYSYPIIFMVFPAVLLLNIAFAILTSIQTKNPACARKNFRQAMLVIKLATIPFFILFFFWMLAIFSLSLTVSLIMLPVSPVVLLLNFLLILIPVLALLTTSVYSISALAAYKRAGMLNLGELIIHCILQFIFVADVIDAIYLYHTLGKREKMQAIDLP